MEIQGKVIAVLPIKDGSAKLPAMSGRAGNLSSRRRKADPAEPVPAADERQHRPVCG